VTFCVIFFPVSLPLRYCICRNHDIWWLEGQLHNRNKNTDSEPNVAYVLKDMKDRIMRKLLVGAFVERVHGIPIFFVHAGIRQDMYTHIMRRFSVENVVKYYLL